MRIHVALTLCDGDMHRIDLGSLATCTSLAWEIEFWEIRGTQWYRAKISNESGTPRFTSSLSSIQRQIKEKVSVCSGESQGLALGIQTPSTPDVKSAKKYTNLLKTNISRL